MEALVFAKLCGRVSSIVDLSGSGAARMVSVRNPEPHGL